MFKDVCLFVYLFVWGFPSHSRIFQSFVDVPLAGEELQILTYARHSWPLSKEGSLTCHIYCDLGLSQPGIEPRSPACKTNALPLRLLGGFYGCNLELFIAQ